MPTATPNKPDLPSGFLMRDFQIGAVRSVEKNDERTVEIDFSSETPIERWGGYEVLDHSDGSVDMARFVAGAALLADHNWRDQIGVILEARIDPETRKGVAKIKFSRSKRGEEFYQDVLDGIRRGVSVGYEILDAEFGGVRNGLDIYRITRWRPLEVSIVSVAADFEGSGFRANGDAEAPAAIAALRTKQEPEQTNLTNNEGDTMPKPTELTPEQTRAATEAAQTAERNRVNELLDAGERFGSVSMAAKMVRDGGSLADLHAKILEIRGTGKVTAASTNDVEIGLTAKESGDFRMTRLIHALANPASRKAQEAAAFEIEASEAAQKKMERMGGSMSDGAAIPFEVLSRGIDAGGSDSASNLIATDLMSGSFIDVLRNRLAVGQAGATTLTGLVGNIAIPRQTAGSSAYWIATEGDEIGTEAEPKFDQVALTPKHLGAFTDVTAQALMQTSLDMEMLIRSDLATALALEIDRAALYGSNASGQPKGVSLQSGIGSIAGIAAGDWPSFAQYVEMETIISQSNADVSAMNYLVPPGARGNAKTTEKFATSNGATIWEPGNLINGYGAIVSNQIMTETEAGTHNDVFFGNWRDLLIGMWGSLNLLVDPYTGGKAGTVRVIARQFVDTAVRHPESFVYAKSTAKS